MHTFLLFLGLTLFSTANESFQQQPGVRPSRPQSRTATLSSDTTNRRRNRRLRPDSLRRGGATRIDTVRRR